MSADSSAGLRGPCAASRFVRALLGRWLRQPGPDEIPEPAGVLPPADASRTAAMALTAERLAHDLDCALAAIIGSTTEIRRLLRTGESVELRFRELER
jgi:hypothetical protein